MIHHRIDRPTRGFLFIGDPHLWSKNPGKRRDVSFLETVLGKIEQAADVANARDLWPVFLGDLLHDERDHDPTMLLRLARALQRFERRPVTLVGNHDKEDLTALSERNSLLLMGVTGQIDLIDSPGFWGLVTITGQDGVERRVALGGTPYGAALPEDVASYAGLAAGTDAKEALGVTAIVWLTHDDLAFGNPYPGAIPMRAIANVDVAVNGHIHAAHRPHVCGHTVWYNPGNITRLTVDLAEHKPSVWGWSPTPTDTVVSAQGIRVPALERFVLRHVPAAEAFDFEGRHVRAEATTVHAHIPEQGSHFVEALKADRQQARTDDGSYLAEAIAAVAVQRQTPAPAQTIVENLFHRAVRGKTESRQGAR